MPALGELQAGFAAALLSGEMASVEAWIEGAGGLAAGDRLRIHRNTMLSTVTGALRLAYPAILALVGADFFEQTACRFATTRPPRSALLCDYGGDFADWLRDLPDLARWPALPDVARLEWAVDRARLLPAFDEATPLARARLPGMSMTLAPSLRLIRARRDAEAIRRAALDGDEAALATIHPEPGLATVAVWHHEDGARTATLGPVAASFLDALVVGAGVDDALASAAAADSTADTIAAIAAEILPSGFVRLIPDTQGDAP